jgi:hypothetical protein
MRENVANYSVRQLQDDYRSCRCIFPRAGIRITTKTRSSLIVIALVRVNAESTGICGFEHIQRG